MILDEDLEHRLRYRLSSMWAADENDQRVITKFKKEVADEPISEEELTELIRERYPSYSPTEEVQEKPLTLPQVETLAPPPTQPVLVRRSHH